MIKLFKDGAYFYDNTIISDSNNAVDEILHKFDKNITKEYARKNTIAYSILKNHNTSDSMENLRIKFDEITSHDLTYVGIIQTAKASGMERFPLPYILTNCHNSLCATGGTINSDDHAFGYTAAKKFGGIYVPPHLAVIHQYMREMHAGCGKMILGSDSHTRYGALGTMGIGEGGGELAKQLLNQPYEIQYPDIIGVYLDGKPQPGVGPHDIALAIVGAVFKSGFVKNKVMEFIGSGINNLSMDFRNGIDVMTTETGCLTSIWQTDGTVKDYLTAHQRINDFKEMVPGDIAYYDGIIYVNLHKIKPMIALPFHPSNVYEIDFLNANLSDILRKTEEDAKHILPSSVSKLNLTQNIVDGKLKVDQAIIAGCSGGTYENISAAADMLEQNSASNLPVSIYPASQPINIELIRKGFSSKLLDAGTVLRTSFCGPCFGAGDVPFNNALSIRHTTRNFPFREGSKPSENQIVSVALMDTRSIVATVNNGGFLTSAHENRTDNKSVYFFNSKPYQNRVYQGYQKSKQSFPLSYGPNIKEWPDFEPLKKNLLINISALICDPITTTDELIPSGETSSYRSNPIKLAEFTLSRKDPDYVPRAKKIQKIAQNSGLIDSDLLEKILAIDSEASTDNISIGSCIFAMKPGDGSAREQAASCQKVLGGIANISKEYATSRYRSNLINWGIIPFLLEDESLFNLNDFIYIPDIVSCISSGQMHIKAYILSETIVEFNLKLESLSQHEKQILLDGCLINYNRNKISL